MTTINNYYYYGNSDELLSKLDLLIQQNQSIMDKQKRFDSMLDRLNTTTNDIASDMKTLKAEIAAGSISEESLQRLDANTATLEAIGASTENPVPEPTPLPGEGEAPAPGEGEEAPTV